MLRASTRRLVLAGAITVGLASASSRAFAEDDEHGEATPAAAVAVAPVATDARAQIAAQLADEAATIERTLALVDRKLAEADAVRVERLRAAYRLLRAPLRTNAPPPERMAAARRRAAARLLVDRDAAERALLVEEARLLRAAGARTVAARAKVATITLPTSLAMPVTGRIVRSFGTLAHERSKTTLSRRGLDLEVALEATVTAPADGTVRYAGPIRGLEDGVIIEHGDYFTVIAKLGDLVVPVGAPVRRGDRLGRAARTRIYMELRVRIGPGGVPIDPEPLLELSR